MKTLSLIVLFSLSIICVVSAQNTENVFLITLDGLRWQELFYGADSLLINDSGYVEDPEGLTEQFWKNDYVDRKQTLMPFIWSTIAAEGQIYGNRRFGNKVNCSNKQWFSYPGYNEILTGFADDDRITSNDKINNPNVTVLEFLNKRKDLNQKVVAFASWDVFPFIINERRSGVKVNAGFEKAEINATDNEVLLNKLQGEVRGPWNAVRLDVFTHHYAMEELKKNSPRVLYIAYGETDDYAHDGSYDQYLKSANQTDAYLKELWTYAQSDEQYRDKTTMIITTDHGRGTVPKDTWKDHGSGVPNGGEIWIAVIGPDTPSLGEVKNPGQYYQNQIARTVAQALGIDYTQDKAGPVIPGVLK